MEGHLEEPAADALAFVEELLALASFVGEQEYVEDAPSALEEPFDALADALHCFVAAQVLAALGFHQPFVVAASAQQIVVASLVLADVGDAML